MPRTARIKSESGIYHIIILRGTNRQIIFEEDEDAVRFLETLGEYHSLQSREAQAKKGNWY